GESTTSFRRVECARSSCNLRVAYFAFLGVFAPLWLVREIKPRRHEETLAFRFDLTNVSISRMGRAHGRDPHPGAVHRAGVDLRAQARRHPAARIQTWTRCPPPVSQPAAAERVLPFRRRGHREPS